MADRNDIGGDDSPQLDNAARDRAERETRERVIESRGQDNPTWAVEAQSVAQANERAGERFDRADDDRALSAAFERSGFDVRNTEPIKIDRQEPRAEERVQAAFARSEEKNPTLTIERQERATSRVQELLEKYGSKEQVQEQTQDRTIETPQRETIDYASRFASERAEQERTRESYDRSR